MESSLMTNKMPRRRPLARTLARGILAKYAGVPWPCWVDLRVTYRCNLRCSYCDLPVHPVPEMGTTDLKKVIDKMNCRGRVILLTGGEPLVRDDVGEIVDHIVFNTDMEVVFNTNLLLLKSRYEEVRNADGFYFSLDGTRETHEKNKGRGSWKGVEEALEILHRDRRGKTSMTVITSATTLDDIRFVLDACQRYEIMPAFQLVRHYAFSRDSREIAPVTSRAEEVFTFLQERRRAGVLMRNSVACLGRMVQLARGGLDGPCYSGKLHATVDADGVVGLCFSRPRHQVFLNLADPGVSWKAAVRALAAVKPHNRRCPTCTCLAPMEFALASLAHPSVLRDTYLVQGRLDAAENRYASRMERGGAPTPPPP
jgi:MoaA/NifB/PqqE/SkfB family radical SAM enzyme